MDEIKDNEIIAGFNIDLDVHLDEYIEMCSDAMLSKFDEIFGAYKVVGASFSLFWDEDEFYDSPSDVPVYICFEVEEGAQNIFFDQSFKARLEWLKHEIEEILNSCVQTKRGELCIEGVAGLEL
jgi:hypothetical protein